MARYLQLVSSVKESVKEHSNSKHMKTNKSNILNTGPCTGYNTLAVANPNCSRETLECFSHMKSTFFWLKALH